MDNDNPFAPGGNGNGDYYEEAVDFFERAQLHDEAFIRHQDDDNQIDDPNLNQPLLEEHFQMFQNNDNDGPAPEPDPPPREAAAAANLAREMLTYSLLSNSLFTNNEINPGAEDVQLGQIRNHILDAMISPTQENILIEHAPGLHGTAMEVILVLENLRHIKENEAAVAKSKGAGDPQPRKVFLCPQRPAETFRVIQDLLLLEQRLEGFQIVLLQETKVQLQGHNGKPIYSVHDIRDIPEDVMEQLQHPNLPPAFDHDGDINLDLLEHADVIICPQKLVLSPLLRRVLRLRLQGSIMIFDDGHNVGGTSRDILSVSITEADFNSIIRMLQGLRRGRNFLNDPGEVEGHQDQGPNLAPLFTQLLENLPRLPGWLHTLEDAVRSKDMILQELRGLYIDLNGDLIELAARIYNELRRIDDHDDDHDANEITDFSVIEKLCSFLLILPEILRRDDGSNYFKLKVEVIEGAHEDDEVKILKIFCGLADLIFQPVGAMASMVIIGGHSLAPYTRFDTGIPGFGVGVTFNLLIQIFYRFVDSRRRFLFASAARGPLGHPFDLDINNRTDARVIQEIFTALLKICQTVPNGVVLLFHSRPYLETTLLRSRLPPAVNGLIPMLEELCNKDVICEVERDVERQPPEEVLQRFKNLARGQNGKNGAIFMALHRGSFYPRMDLQDLEVRATVHVSMPFGDFKRGEVLTTKKELFHSLNNLPRGVQPDGMLRDWNGKDCMKVLNESFAQTYQGSEENPNEWGMVIVLDSRFHSRRSHSYDSSPFWVEQCQSAHFDERTRFENMMESVTLLVDRFRGGNDNDQGENN